MMAELLTKEEKALRFQDDDHFSLRYSKMNLLSVNDVGTDIKVNVANFMTIKIPTFVPRERFI